MLWCVAFAFCHASSLSSAFSAVTSFGSLVCVDTLLVPFFVLWESGYPPRTVPTLPISLWGFRHTAFQKEKPWWCRAWPCIMPRTGREGTCPSCDPLDELEKHVFENSVPALDRAVFRRLAKCGELRAVVTINTCWKETGPAIKRLDNTKLSTEQIL